MSDKYELVLEEKLVVLQSCQKNKALKSCFECDEFFSCKTRDAYVVSVYESMNKGAQDSGFDF